MPGRGAKVVYKFGTQSEYDRITPNPNTLYFITDNAKLYVGSQEYCNDVKVASSLNLPTPEEAKRGQMYIVYGEETDMLITCVKHEGEYKWFDLISQTFLSLTP